VISKPGTSEENVEAQESVQAGNVPLGLPKVESKTSGFAGRNSQYDQGAIDAASSICRDARSAWSDNHGDDPPILRP
jgi:hypothetical protein